jgi:hypothetical protein
MLATEQVFHRPTGRTRGGKWRSAPGIVVAAGVHPLHFGIIMAMNLSIGLYTPPFGLNLFAAHAPQAGRCSATTSAGRLIPCPPQRRFPQRFHDFGVFRGSIKHTANQLVERLFSGHWWHLLHHVGSSSKNVAGSTQGGCLKRSADCAAAGTASNADIANAIMGAISPDPSTP